MSYQVIARKWRPQRFSELVGQQHVTTTLQNALRTNRVAHAYIFSGARGVGKTTTARILAKSLNCVNGPTPDPCNACDACREITAGGSLDVIEIDAASNRGIDQIRELREMVRYAPAAGRSKVVILDEAHQLTDEASNALLKTLEEPPEKVVFVLATTQPESLADTIRSRAQHFHFRALTFAEISDAIERITKEEKLKMDSGARAVIARAAEGSLRDSLSLLEQAIAYCGTDITDAQVRELLGVVPEEILDELVEAIAAQSTQRALGLVHKLIAEGQNLQHFCREAIRHFRNLMVARVCGAESDLIAAPADERPRLARQSQVFGEEDLTRFFQILLSTDDDLRRKPDPRLHLEMGLLRLVTAKRLAPLEEVIAELRGAELHGPDASGRGGSPARPAGGTMRPASTSATASASPSAATASAAPRATPSASAVPAASVQRGAVAPAADVTPRQAREEFKSFTEERVPPAVPVSVPPPSVVARAAEQIAGRFDGLTAAQVDAIKTAIRTQQKFLASLVEHVSRWELEGSEMRLYFPTERSALADMLQARDPIEKLRAISSQVMGQPVRVCVRLDSASGSAAPSPRRAEASPSGRRVSMEARAEFEEDPIVRAMLERFGGRISDVRKPGEEE